LHEKCTYFFCKKTKRQNKQFITAATDDQGSAYHEIKTYTEFYQKPAESAELFETSIRFLLDFSDSYWISLIFPLSLVGIVRDLIVGCGLPISIVENKSFRHHYNILDERFTMMSR